MSNQPDQKELRAHLDAASTAPDVHVGGDTGDGVLVIPASTATSEGVCTDGGKCGVGGYCRACPSTAASEQQAGADELPALPLYLGISAAENERAHAYAVTYARAALRHRGCALADQQTERKTQQIGERDGMARTGYILQDDTGRACIVHQGAVRWLSNAELWNVVHPAADQQGDMAIGRDAAYNRAKFSRSVNAEDFDAGWDAAIAQQGAAQAQAGANGIIPAQEFLSWNRRKNSPPVAIGKEMGVFRKAMEFAAMAAPATSGGGNG